MIHQRFARYRYIVLAAAIVVIIAAVGSIFFLKFLSRTGQAETGATFAKEYGLVLHDYSGKEVRMSAFRGKIMIAYAWASWCPYCAEELGNLGRLKEMYGDKIEVVAVNRAEPLSVAKGYTDRLANAQGVVFLVDPADSFYKTVDGYAMPETVFIDEHGKILYHQRGPMRFEEVSQRIRTLIP